MGGKNCVIVDADADLDDVVPAVISSAFLYAGQKCSAASRVLAHEAIAGPLVERLAGVVQTLQLGQADTFGTDVPPVIEQEAQDRVNRYRQIAEHDGRIAATSDQAAPDHGWFVAPTLAADLRPESKLLTDEVFGPLLTVEAVKDVGDALDRIDQLGYALTSGLFARNPRTVEEVAGATRSATSTSTARSPARWSGASRLAATACRAPAPRPAARTTCCTSSSPAW